MSRFTAAANFTFLFLFANALLAQPQTSAGGEPSAENSGTASSSSAGEGWMQPALARAETSAFSRHWSATMSEQKWFRDVAFSPEPPQGNPQQTPPPATTPAAPSLGDLGFPTAASQGSAQEQARLDRRSHMLKIHQRLGLIDIAPLVATLILGTGAGGKSTSSTDRWAHMALGSVTGDLYFMSAYYAIRAPRIQGTQPHGQIRLHKALAWVHGPGMILTPILGALAFDQKSKGEKVHGIASAHGAVAAVTAIAYGLAVVSVSIKF
ncbi:MAG TPA: hypothetical protein VGN17_03675 [Bryobacteraceae bacterium]|jgi:hypothetical protein